MNMSSTFEQNEMSYTLIRSNLSLFSALMKGPHTLEQLSALSGKSLEQVSSTLHSMERNGLIQKNENRFESIHHSIHLTRDERLETLVNQYFFPVISTALVCEAHPQFGDEVVSEEWFLLLEPDSAHVFSSSIITPFLQSLAGNQSKRFSSDIHPIAEFQFCCFGVYHQSQNSSDRKPERVISNFQQSLIAKNNSNCQKQSFVKFAEMFLFQQDMQKYHQVSTEFQAELKKYSVPRESSNFYLSFLRVPKSLVSQTGGCL